MPSIQINRQIVESRNQLSELTPTQLDSNLTICLVSGSISSKSSPREYSKITRGCLEEYSHRHGYHLNYFTQVYDSSAPLIWQKVYAVKEALDQGHQVVVWVDDDIYITNPSIKIESFLEMTNAPLIFARDLDHFANYINTGIYVIRNTPITREFIKDTLQGRLTIEGGYWNKHNYHEQSVMLYLITGKYLAHAKVLPRRVMQSYSIKPDWQEGDFILHMAGEKSDRRLELSQLLLKQQYDQVRAILYPK